MRRAGLSLALWLCLCGMARADDALQVLRDFADALYAAGAEDHGGAARWAALEQQAIARLRTRPDTLTMVNDNRRTPLMVAAANGYGFAVNWLLRDGAVRDTLNARDKYGLSARDLAQIAMRQTAQACAPRSDNPDILVPLMATLPYYIDRQPYPAILHALDAAGARADDQGVRAHWLVRCPGADPGLRARIGGAAPVQRSLLEGAQEVMIAKCSAEARLRHRGITRMFAGRSDAAGVLAQSRAQLNDRIAECAAGLAGFLPD